MRKIFAYVVKAQTRWQCCLGTQLGTSTSGDSNVLHMSANYHKSAAKY